MEYFYNIYDNHKTFKNVLPNVVCKYLAWQLLYCLRQACTANKQN